MNPEEDFTVVEAVLIIFFSVIMRSLTTFIHELGHAIPALFFTKETVRIYVGSYGDPEQSIIFRIGRIQFFFKFNSFEWGRGMCVFQSEERSWWKMFLITLSGPFISLLFSLVLFLLVYNFELSNGSWFVLVLLIVSGIWDFIINMIPLNEPIKLFSGEKIHSDGYVLLKMFKAK